MYSVSKFSFALLLVATVATDGLTEASNLRQERFLQEKDDYCKAMLARVNKERAAKGKSALCLNKKLQAAAQRHSDDMAKNNYMAHDGKDGSTMSQRITEVDYTWESVAENVAAGQADVEAVMDSWMASPDHYENIMGEYVMLGVAFTYNADTDFGYYWTQDFATGGTEACDPDDSTTVQTVPPTKSEGSTTQETVQQNVTPAPTTSTPPTSAPTTPAPLTPVPEVTPAPTTSTPETPATVVPDTDKPEVPATKAPVPTPAATTPAPVVTPAATTTPPSTPSIPTQEDCKSNF